MLNHRHKRILFPVLFVKEMTLICPEAPSGCQNPQEFPKGIRLSPHISHSDGSANSAPREGTRPTNTSGASCRPRALTRRLEV